MSTRAIKTLQGHLAAIQSGEVTKTNVIGLRKAINLTERLAGGWSVPAYVTDDYRAQVWECIDWLEREQPKVVGELHDTGLQTLRNPRYRKRLEDYLDLIEWPSHFQLLRYSMIGRNLGHAIPVYRLTGQNGGTLTFRNIPWQSGGNGPEVHTGRDYW